MRVFKTVAELSAAVGEELGVSEWVEMTQERVNQFADATEDHQWIHVDPERAAEGPFGGTIAHGFLSLSLIPWLASEVYEIATPGPRLNYGLNKVRFPSPVRVGSRVRLSVKVTEAAAKPAGFLVATECALMVEGQDRPACVAETLTLLPEAK